VAAVVGLEPVPVWSVLGTRRGIFVPEYVLFL